jgi:hypothetical protein
MLFRNVLLPLVVLSALYGLAIFGLVLLFRALRVPSRGSVFLGFLTFGLVTGLLTAWVWPLDSSVYANVYAALLGDAVYQLAAAHLGAPWLLCVPQVYVVVSTALYGLLGLMAQGICLQVKKRRPRPMGSHP